MYLTLFATKPYALQHAGPKKTPFLCRQGRVVHARGRVVLGWWTKVNTVQYLWIFRTFCQWVSLIPAGCNSCRLVPKIAGCLQL